MSDAETKARWFRVYSADRKVRKAVGANTLDHLTSEARRKFGLDSEEEVSIVLEEDGTSVDEEDYFQDGLQPNSVLMLLKSNETWTECGEVVLDESERDELDCSTPHHDNVHLKQLCSQLRRDLKNILLFTVVDCQALADADRDVLCQLLHRSSHDVDMIQSACQRYVDEHDEFNEARSLLRLIQKDARDSTTNDVDDLEAKRKRWK